MNELSIKELILEEYQDEKKHYEFLCKSIVRITEEIITKKQIEYSTITGRVKELKSLEDKIDKKEGKYTHLNDITDIAGIRIITYYSDDVERIADLITQEFSIDLDNSIDKRKSLDPDKFGYLSVHYVCQMNDKRLALPEYADLKGFKFEI